MQKKNELLSSSASETIADKDVSPQPCSKSADEESIDTDQPQEHKSMKWHKFVINFALPAQMICFFIIGVLLATLPFIDDVAISPLLSKILDKPVQVSFDSDLEKIAYVFYGSIIILAGWLTISARKKLVKYHSSGPGFLTGSSYGWIFVPNIPLLGALYCDQIQNIFDVNEDMVYAISACGALVLMAFAMTFIFGNLSYYKKRKHMFTDQ